MKSLTRPDPRPPTRAEVLTSPPLPRGAYLRMIEAMARSDGEYVPDLETDPDKSVWFVVRCPRLGCCTGTDTRVAPEDVDAVREAIQAAE